MSNIVYKIDEGYWLVSEASFIREKDIPEGAVIIPLVKPDGESSVALLYETLKFYKYPLGELASEADKLEYLLRENKEYLLSILLMYALDVEVPQEGLKQFAEIKAAFKKADAKSLLSLLGE